MTPLKPSKKDPQDGNSGDDVENGGVNDEENDGCSDAKCEDDDDDDSHRFNNPSCKYVSTKAFNVDSACTRTGACVYKLLLLFFMSEC